MNPMARFSNVSKTLSLFSWNKSQARDWIVASHSHSLSQSRSQSQASVSGVTQRCHYCHLRQSRQTGSHSHTTRLRKRSPLYSIQVVVTPLSSFSSVTKETPSFEVSENACPQGVQGDINSDCSTFNLWLDNCRRYGLENCDQQLQGVQSGRKTMAEVMAEQDKLIADIAAEYRRQNAERRQVSFQGVQQGVDVNRLPDISTPCPQGIQGEDCARFKLWLENCHRFQFGNCQNQLDSYNKGRITLQQLFEDQYSIIREAAQSASTPTKTTSENITETPVQQDPSKPLTSAQKLRNAVAVYGSTVMVFHISMSLMSLGFFYTLVSSGIDVVGLLGRLGIGETILQSKLATGTGTFVVAYAVHKVFAPARIAITLTATPLIVRYLRRIRFLKTPPPKK